MLHACLTHWHICWNWPVEIFLFKICHRKSGTPSIFLFRNSLVIRTCGICIGPSDLFFQYSHQLSFWIEKVLADFRQKKKQLWTQSLLHLKSLYAEECVCHLKQSIYAVLKYFLSNPSTQAISHLLLLLPCPTSLLAGGDCPLQCRGWPLSPMSQPHRLTDVQKCLVCHEPNCGKNKMDRIKTPAQSYTGEPF